MNFYNCLWSLSYVDAVRGAIVCQIYVREILLSCDSFLIFHSPTRPNILLFDPHYYPVTIYKRCLPKNIYEQKERERESERGMYDGEDKVGIDEKYGDYLSIKNTYINHSFFDILSIHVIYH